MQNTRRDFIKKAVVAAAISPGLTRGAGRATAAPASEDSSDPKTYLEPFNYKGVRLLDGMLKKQYWATRDYYYAIPDDDILRGFRMRAGLRAPGNDLGGWYSG
ncbi:MAG TPA: hypothetical protein VFD30_05060, partial [Terriglobia bacterium]|nr:hypothetical protein [Terriglobia bacterium]